MKKLALASLAASFLSLATADDLYVDCGDPLAADDAAEGRGSSDLPYRTIQAAVDAAVRDDAVGTIWVRPGVYADGSSASSADACNPNQQNRVVLKKRLRLVSTAGAGRTEIRGRFGDPANAHLGAETVRALLVEPAAAGSIVEGFTLGCGATRHDKGTNRATNPDRGGGFYAPGGDCYLVDSVVTNCFAAFGGGVGGTAVRCLVKSCGGPFWNSASVDAANLWNCVVVHDYYRSSSAGSQKSLAYVTNVNCTVVNNNLNYADFLDCKSYNLLSVAFAPQSGKEEVSGESHGCIYRKGGRRTACSPGWSRTTRQTTQCSFARSEDPTRRFLSRKSRGKIT